jgi:hypothetical protein
MENSRIVLDGEFFRGCRNLHLVDQARVAPCEETVPCWRIGRIPHLANKRSPILIYMRQVCRCESTYGYLPASETCVPARALAARGVNPWDRKRSAVAGIPTPTDEVIMCDVIEQLFKRTSPVLLGIL